MLMNVILSTKLLLLCHIWIWMFKWEAMWCMSFWVWLILLNIIFPHFHPLPAKDIYSVHPLYSWTNSIVWCVCVVCMCVCCVYVSGAVFLGCLCGMLYTCGWRVCVHVVYMWVVPAIVACVLHYFIHSPVNVHQVSSVSCE